MSYEVYGVRHMLAFLALCHCSILLACLAEADYSLSDCKGDTQMRFAKATVSVRRCSLNPLL